jgi:HupE / UreJ protein
MRSALACVVVLLAASAWAHPLAPSLLEVREGADGRLAVRWKTPSRVVPGSTLAPELPAECHVVAERFPDGTPLEVITEWDVACEPGGLVGRRLGVRGIASSRADVLARVQLADGRRILRVLRPGEETFVVPAREGAWAVLVSYGRLGIAHIASGFDHLCFVLGLVLLVGGGWRLLETITAFTVGHSMTLSLATLGVVGFPVRPVEVLIAFSIYVLAVELLRRRPGRLGRRPWLMACGFGLLHGFGFAGALADVGLPAGDIPLALFGFNAGIEVGQIGFVVLVLALGRLGRPLARRAPRLQIVPAYAIGSLAAFWMLGRLLPGPW